MKRSPFPNPTSVALTAPALADTELGLCRQPGKRELDSAPEAWPISPGVPGRRDHDLNSSSPVATIQLRSRPCRRRDLAAILADSVTLLQTPAVAEPGEVGVELSADASHVMTGIPSASHPQGVRVGRSMAAALAAYEQHLGLTTSRRRS